MLIHFFAIVGSVIFITIEIIHTKKYKLRVLAYPRLLYQQNQLKFIIKTIYYNSNI